MKESHQYIKIVEWSNENQCITGQCSEIVGPCCHGNDEAIVYSELCQIVDEWIEHLKKEGKPLSPSTAGRNIADRIFEAYGFTAGALSTTFGLKTADAYCEGC